MSNSHPNYAAVPTSSLKTNKRINEAAALPRWTQELKTSIYDSIKSEGIREPLTIWKGKSIVIDGLERLRAAKAIGIESVPIIERDISDEQEAIRWRMLANVQRRYLNSWHRCNLAMNYVSSFMKKRKNKAGDKWKEAGSLFGVSAGLISNAEYIKKHIERAFGSNRAGELLNDLDKGEKSIGKVFSLIDNKIKAGDIEDDDDYPKGINDGPLCPKSSNGGRKGKKQNSDSRYVNQIINDQAVEGMTLIPDGKASLVITSPPYMRAKHTYRGTFNPNAKYSMFLDLMENCAQEWFRILRDGGKIAINIDETVSDKKEEAEQLGYRLPVHNDVTNIMRDAGFKHYCWIAWYKHNGSGASYGIGDEGNVRFRPTKENILIFFKNTPTLKNITGGRECMSRTDISRWSFDFWYLPPAPRLKKDNPDHHPCPFPYRLPYRLIQMLSFENDLIVDPFMGTGTTARAAKDLNRRYFGSDQVQEYVDYANRRCELSVSKELDKARKEENVHESIFTARDELEILRMKLKE